MPIIEVDQLTKHYVIKHYGKRIAVKNVSFSLEAGAVFGFIGPNGAGKTTTIRILTTLLRPTAGWVQIDGHSIVTEPRAVRKIIGYMPDFFGVYPDMTVWEYLDFFSACYDISPAQRPGLIKDLLTLVELTHRRDDSVDTLSRGMKQRLCLARALVHDPKILVLDEPAAGLDPRARIEFRELLAELQRMGKTIFLSSHILADIAEICTEVGIIEAGRMVTHGNIEEIKRQMRQNHHLRVRVLSGYVEQAQAVLAVYQGIQKIEIEPTPNGETDLLVELCGDKVAVCALLRQLVLANLPVSNFSEEIDSLEDVFMKLTQGIVS